MSLIHNLGLNFGEALKKTTISEHAQSIAMFHLTKPNANESEMIKFSEDNKIDKQNVIQI